MSKSSEVSVSEEDRKTLRNLDNEIADRLKEFTNILSKYIDVSVESPKDFGYSRKAGKKKGEDGIIVTPGCWTMEVHTAEGGTYCHDDCRGMCYDGPCRPTF